MPACQPGSDFAPAAATVADPDEDRAKRPRHVALAIPAGEGILLTGEVDWQGPVDGVFRVDVLTLADGKPPELVHQSTLDAAGAFQLTLPAGFGDAHLVAYLDRNDNGPSAGEPVASLAVRVEQAPISGLTLALSTDKDLGRLAPGAPPPDSAGPPPEHNGGSVEESSQAAAGR